MTKRGVTNVVSDNQLAMFPNTSGRGARARVQSDRSQSGGKYQSVTNSLPRGGGGGTPLKGLLPPTTTACESRSKIAPRSIVLGSDVLGLRAALFPYLPLPATLCGSSALTGVVLYVTSSAAVWKALRRSGRVVFGLREWMMLVSSFAEGRASVASLDEWCEYKRKLPTWKLTLREAMGVEWEPRPHAQATIGEVFRGWGIELVEVSYGDEVAA